MTIKCEHYLKNCIGTGENTEKKEQRNINVC